MTNWTPNLDPQLPRYLAIAQAIAADLESGRLSPGDRLPTHRELAWQLGVTVGTVTRAYQEAERRGLLSGEVGRGSFLRDPLGGRGRTVTAGERGPLDLQMAVPPRVCSPAEFDQALMRLMADPSRLDHLDYPPVAGLPEHREMARSWLRRAGVDVPANQIALTSGAQHGLAGHPGDHCAGRRQLAGGAADLSDRAADRPPDWPQARAAHGRQRGHPARIARARRRQRAGPDRLSRSDPAQSDYHRA